MLYIVFYFFIFWCIRKWLTSKRVSYKQRESQRLIIGFFHPYCNAGGGGERVLWTAIVAIQRKYEDAQCIVYTGDTNVTKEEILQNVQKRFKVTFPRDIKFVYLKSRCLVEPKLYPFFTLLFQSLGSIVLGIEALLRFPPPDIYIDTMGYAFTLPIFKYLASCKIACYVHYPTISTDMLESVTQRNVGVVHNRPFISNSRLLSGIKIYYYKMFAYLYGFMGKRSNVVMVNSTWTKNHIVSLWQSPETTKLVYPPCDVVEFEKIPLSLEEGTFHVISIAQFRPEKNHKLQIQSFHNFLNKLSQEKRKKVKLVLIGGSRHKEDFQLIENLKSVCSSLKIEDYVDFKINVNFEEMLDEMKMATAALHTMWNEHFGIGVVECMSAGLITIAHDSGGPKLDIVVDFEGEKTGFLAKDIDSFSSALRKAMEMPKSKKARIRENCRKSARRFSVQNFEEQFLKATDHLFL